jgi:hypothetical protein
MLVRVMLAGFLAGCTGAISSPPGRDEGTRDPEIEDPTTPPATAFVEPTDRMQLLPFDVRLNRLASVAGVPATDPMFDELRAHRFELGDHDYAHGTGPDLSWTASRMAVWLRAVRPVCDSPQMKERYPSISGSLDDLVLAAYGRRAVAADRQAYDAAIAGGAPADEAATYRATCLAFLSSTEFVAR